jgi:hypothetical protein
VERAATVLQPEQDTLGQSRKTTAQEMLKTAYMSEISRQDSTYRESFDLTYKEGVAGSTPASPTIEKYRFAGKSQRLKEVLRPFGDFSTLVVHQRGPRLKRRLQVTEFPRGPLVGK